MQTNQVKYQIYRHLFMLFTISLIFSSCVSKDRQAIETVNQLQEKVVEMQNKYNKIDYLAIRIAQNQYNESMSIIKKYYFKDTIDKEFMQALDIYRAVKIGTKVINKNKDVIEKNLTFVRQQLRDLKEDLVNVSIQGEEVEKAMTTETTNVNRLDSALQFYLSSVENLLFAHDSVAIYIKNKTRTF